MVITPRCYKYHWRHNLRAEALRHLIEWGVRVYENNLLAYRVRGESEMRRGRH